MAYLNELNLIGHLTRNPELREVGDSSKVAEFGFATNRPYRDKAGNQHFEVCYVDVEAWDALAELVAKFLKEGSPAFLQGRLIFKQWEDKEGGGKRSRLAMRLENVQFLGQPRGSDEGEGGEYEESQQSRPEPRQTQASRPQQGAQAPKAPTPAKGKGAARGR